jgi:ribonuclease P protein component
MLPRKNSLKKEKDFKRVFQKGRSFKGPSLSLRIAKNGLDINRIGLMVSRRISKKAVVRNKIRRRLSELIEARIPELKKGYDIILIAGPETEKKSFKELGAALDKIFQKAGLI